VYLDPGSSPLAFAHAASSRVPFLLQGALALPWSDLASFYSVIHLATPALVGAVVGLAGMAGGFARLLVRDPLARFWATGMVLSAIPIASTFPADRLLGFVSIGAMGLVAQFLAAAFTQRELLGDGRLRRTGGMILAVVLVLCNLVLAPPLLVLRSRSMVAVGRVLDRADAGIPRDPSIAGKTVVIVATPSDALAAYVKIMRVSRGLPAPAHVIWLTTATTDVTVERVDDRALRVRPHDGLLHYEIDQMVRNPQTLPFTPAETHAVPGATISVENDHTLLARFAIPLDDPSLVWLRWEGKTYAPYTPPAIGARETLPAVDFWKLLEE
jgi:hypothetical protein